MISSVCNRDNNIDFESYSSEIRTLLTTKCGIMRNERSLIEAYARISEILELLDTMELNTIQSVETYNQSLIALTILQESIRRKKSVGAHYRSDDEE